MAALRNTARNGFRFFTITILMLLGLAVLPPAEDAFAAAELNLSGLFYDPANSGHGFDFNVLEQGLIVYYYGHTSTGERLWLISDIYTPAIELNVPFELQMYEKTEGEFGHPGEPTTFWGTVTVTISNCSSGNALFSGIDGNLEMELLRLASPEGVNCDPEAVDEFWFRDFQETYDGRIYDFREAFARRSRVKEYNCLFSSEYANDHPDWIPPEPHFVWNDDAGFYTGVGDWAGIGIEIVNDRVCGAFFDPDDPVYELVCNDPRPKLTKVDTWAEATAGDYGICDPFP